MKWRWPRAIVWFLRVLVGGVFLASALLKLYPIEPFELTLIDVGLFSWRSAHFISRIIISVELFLGILILANIHYQKFTFPATLFLLIGFSIYIVYLLFVEGNEADCGCLGAYMQLTPVESLLKNGTLLLAIMFLRSKGSELRPSWRWMTPIALATIATPLILNPIQLNAHEEGSNTQKPYHIDLSSMPQPMDANAGIQLEKGEKILAFFLVECSHCKDAAHKLAIVSKQYDMPEVFFVFKSDQKEVEEFIKASKSDLPYIIFKDRQIFEMTKGIFPTVLYINDGIVYKKWTGEMLSNLEMEKFSDLKGRYLR